MSTEDVALRSIREPPSRTALLVLGMHRSGTSALTGALRLCGAWVGEEAELTRANVENPWGFWERRDVREICDRLLHAAGADWWKVANFDLQSIPHAVLSEQRGRFKEVVSVLTRHDLWVIKEPRLCLLLPALRDYVENPVCVHVFRNPLEVAKSLQLRNGFSISAGLALWETYSRHALKASENLPRLFIAHESLMLDPSRTLERLVEDLEKLSVAGLEKPEHNLITRLIDPSLYRQRASEAELRDFLSPSQQTIWSLLCSNYPREEGDYSSIPHVTRQHLFDLESTELSLSHYRNLHKTQTERIETGDRVIDSLKEQRERTNSELKRRAGAIEFRDARIVSLKSDLESTKLSLRRYRDRHKAQLKKIRKYHISVCDLKQERERTNSELARRGEVIELRDARIEDLKKQRERANAELARRAGAIEFRNARIEDLRRDFARQKAIVKALHSSVSWKITLPLRAMRRLGERCGRRSARLSDATRAWSPKYIARARRYIARIRRLVHSRLTVRRSGQGERQERSRHLAGHPLSILLAEHRRAIQSRSAGVAGVRRRSSTAVDCSTKITVVAWNVSHNALGRAYLLADVLRREYEVEVIAAEFPRFGEGVWEPLRYCSRVTIKSFPGGEFPGHFKRMEDIAKKIEGDVIYVSKPRLPSLELAILAKLHRNRPVILDIDDYELGFFKKRQALSLSKLRTAHSYPDFHLPHHETWTRYSESLIPLFEELTVSNEELRKKFGGMVLPHIRDESEFDPTVYPREDIRSALGFSSRDKVVLFVGTPRTHKGVNRIAQALEKLDRSDYKFLTVGSPVDGKCSRFYHSVDPQQVKAVPNVPFSDIPSYLASGDLVCLLQDADDVTSHFQMPAKFTDGLAMGIPILATDVPPLKNLANGGLVELLGDTPLDVKICEVFENLEIYKRRAVQNRETFIQEYSYDANLPRLTEVISRVRDKPAPIPQEFYELVAYHREMFSKDLLSPNATLKIVAGDHSVASHSHTETLATRRITPSYVDDKLDIVFFWKQNDTGIYGRRQDMLVKYLARDTRIHRILHFDAPISWSRLIYDAVKTRRLGRHSHNFLILTKTLRNILTPRFLASRSVILSTFVFFSRDYLPERMRRIIPSEKHYLDYLDRMFRRYKLGERRTVFWVCPRDFHFPSVVETFQPDLVVADVIDDHRKWPSINSEYERRLDSNYEAILNRSHIVFANCERVAEGMQPYAGNVQLLPNAAEDLEEQSWHWRKPMRLSAMSGPVIGYVGNLDIARLDLELLETVAERRPDWNLVFIGSMHRNDSIRTLDQFSNVHFLGVRRYDRALRYIRYFDVAMVPHLNNELTQHMSPLKLYVYLSLHVPVVATEIENLGDFGGFVRVGSSPEAFMDAIDFCLKHDVYAGKKQMVRRFLRENSWQCRVKDVLTIVEAEFRRQESVSPQ